MKAFGSIGALFAAPDKAIAAQEHKGETWLAGLLSSRALLQVALHEDVARSRLDSADPRLRRWVQMQFMGARTERLMALFGDRHGHLINSEVLAIGDEAHLFTSARDIFHRALMLDARTLVLAHNHPGALPEPSALDISSTRRIAELGRALGITLTDHLVVGEPGLVSMAERGLL